MTSLTFTLDATHRGFAIRSGGKYSHCMLGSAARLAGDPPTTWLATAPIGQGCDSAVRMSLNTGRTHSRTVDPVTSIRNHIMSVSGPNTPNNSADRRSETGQDRTNDDRPQRLASTRPNADSSTACSLHLRS